MARTRTFIAIETAEALRHRATELARALVGAAPDFKWTPTEKLHWTLQFLGDVDDLEIPSVCRAVAEVAARHASFELQAAGAGAFPSADRPRTLWIGAGEGSKTLAELQQAIEGALKQMGFRGEERRFVPHLTLGRAGRHVNPRSLAPELAACAEFDAGTMIVDEVVVFASRLSREGSTYEALGRAPLSQ
jgi:2'-5' RNA ligase